MKCIIHVGMHKTGSTSIQNVLASNKFDEFDYLSLDVPNHSVALYTIFSNDPKGHHLLAQRGMNEARVSSYRNEMLGKLKAQVERCEKDFVISGEVLSSPGSDNLLIGLKELLAPHFSEIKVVGYVRPPIAFTQSDFQEGVKGGAARFNVRQKFPKYRERFAKLDEIFGRENVDLVKFSKDTLYEGDVVQDFLVRIGVKTPQLSAGRANESLSLETVSVLYAFQKSRLESGGGSLPPQQKNALIELLRPLGSSKVVFGQQLVDHLLSEFGDEVEWMESRLGCDLNESPSVTQAIDCENDLLNVAKDQSPALLNLLKNRYDQQNESLAPLIVEGLARSISAETPNTRISKLSLEDIAQQFGLELHVLHRELGRLLAAKGNRAAAATVLDEGLMLHPKGDGLRRLRDEVEKK